MLSSYDLNETLTTQEVLQELGISRGTLYKWMSRGLISPVNHNSLFERQSKLLFLKSDVADLKLQAYAQPRSA